MLAMQPMAFASGDGGGRAKKSKVEGPRRALPTKKYLFSTLPFMCPILRQVRL
jgi:hypothetical protein